MLAFQATVALPQLRVMATPSSSNSTIRQAIFAFFPAHQMNMLSAVRFIK